MYGVSEDESAATCIYIAADYIQLLTNDFEPFRFWKQEETTYTNLEITRNSKYSTETANNSRQ